MKVLEWIETETQYLAVIQKREIFETDSFFEGARHGREAIIKGKRKDTGEIDWFAYAWDKALTPFWVAKRWAEIAPDVIE